MSSIRNVVILDGTRNSDNKACTIIKCIKNSLKDYAPNIELFELHNIQIAPCTGCLGCWLRTPGLCVTKDAGCDITKAIVQSDLFIFITPIVNGGYSSHLKKAVDRLCPMANPYFFKRNGITQHIPRYDKLFHFIAIGILEEDDESEAAIFKKLVDRNSVNFIKCLYDSVVIRRNEKEEDVTRKLQETICTITNVK